MFYIHTNYLGINHNTGISGCSAYARDFMLACCKCSHQDQDCRFITQKLVLDFYCASELKPPRKNVFQDRSVGNRLFAEMLTAPAEPSWRFTGQKARFFKITHFSLEYSIFCFLLPLHRTLSLVFPECVTVARRPFRCSWFHVEAYKRVEAKIDRHTVAKQQ